METWLLFIKKHVYTKIKLGEIYNIIIYNICKKTGDVWIFLQPIYKHGFQVELKKTVVQLSQSYRVIEKYTVTKHLIQ